VLKNDFEKTGLHFTHLIKLLLQKPVRCFKSKKGFVKDVFGGQNHQSLQKSNVHATTLKASSNVSFVSFLQFQKYSKKFKW
jgi:hypothetical protein